MKLPFHERTHHVRFLALLQMIRSVSFIPKNARSTRRAALRVENNPRMIQLDNSRDSDINYCKLKDEEKDERSLSIDYCRGVALRHAFGKETTIR